jgi:hypothetical protein
MCVLESAQVDSKHHSCNKSARRNNFRRYRATAPHLRVELELDLDRPPIACQNSYAAKPRQADGCDTAEFDNCIYRRGVVKKDNIRAVASPEIVRGRKSVRKPNALMYVVLLPMSCILRHAIAPAARCHFSTTREESARDPISHVIVANALDIKSSVSLHHGPPGCFFRYSCIQATARSSAFRIALAPLGGAASFRYITAVFVNCDH